MKHLVPWLTLKSVPAIGNLLFARLLRHFGSPERALCAPTQALAQVEGITPRLAQAIQRHRTPDWIFKDIDQAAEKGYAIVTFQDEVYPALLKQIPDPPPVLFVHGRLEKPFCPIAVVGSRKATNYGLTTTHRLCTDLAERGATVVSGMARGIDTAAHQGALAGKGRTIAVLGSGLNQIYPAENRKLFQQIAENGCVVSEFFMDAAPEPHHFPMRNRVISGMSLGTVVVEAARNSGSLITARLAAEQNREVFAVPGSIHAATAKGTHDLIKQGAKLVEEADDILDEIAPQLARPETGAGLTGHPALPPLTEPELKVLSAMDVYPVHIDPLARRLEMRIGELAAVLSQLELKGAVRQEAGKNFVRCK
jgi:DNA processing protein